MPTAPSPSRSPRPEPRLGVCSWSTGATEIVELVETLRAVGVDALQIALDPLREGAAGTRHTRAELERAGIQVCSGMMGTVGEDYSSLETIRATGGVRPDRHWPANLERARGNAEVARELGVELVSLHAGFLPEEPSDPERAVLLDRLRTIADTFAAEGVAVALETGQETAQTLLSVLRELERPSVGVNFDPANMLLYGMGDPVEALQRLAPFVRQIHVKDAVRARVPGAWGEEVPVGDGEVDWKSFFGVVREAGIDVDCMIEREAGDQRVADMQRAAQLVRRERGAGAAN